MAVGVPVYVVTCAVNEQPCSLANQRTTAGFLIDQGYSAQAEILLASSGIDWTTVVDAFGMSLLMFAVGLGFGLITNIVKKAR